MGWLNWFLNNLRLRLPTLVCLMCDLLKLRSFWLGFNWRVVDLNLRLFRQFYGTLSEGRFIRTNGFDVLLYGLWAKLVGHFLSLID